MLMGIIFIIFMGIFIKCCAVHTPSSNPRKPPARRFSETLRRPITTLRRMVCVLSQSYSCTNTLLVFSSRLVPQYTVIYCLQQTVFAAIELDITTTHVLNSFCWSSCKDLRDPRMFRNVYTVGGTASFTDAGWTN